MQEYCKSLSAGLIVAVPLLAGGLFLKISDAAGTPEAKAKHAVLVTAGYGVQFARENDGNRSRRGHCRRHAENHSAGGDGAKQARQLRGCETVAL